MNCKTIEDCLDCSEYHVCSNNKAKYVIKLQKRIEELEKKVEFLEKDMEIKPSITPKQRTGKWIYHTIGFHKCSCCSSLWATNITKNTFCNYCPRCGAKMEKEKMSEGEENENC